MKLIAEINEEIQVITEADESGKKNYFIEGIFMQGEMKNRNNRFYPINVLDREAGRYVKENVKQNRAYGELGHPSGPTINLERVSHMIKSLVKDGNNYIGRAKILDTPYGNIVKNLMAEGAKLGVSSRGVGSLVEKGGVHRIQEDYHLATPADIVADPSAPNAFVRGVMENREWVWENGIFKEVDVNAAKNQIEAAVRSREPEKFVEIFERFMKSL